MSNPRPCRCTGRCGPGGREDKVCFIATATGEEREREKKKKNRRSGFQIKTKTKLSQI